MRPGRDGCPVWATCRGLRPLIIALQDPWFGNGWNLGRLGLLVGIGAVAWAVAAFRLSRD